MRTLYILTAPLRPSHVYAYVLQMYIAYVLQMYIYINISYHMSWVYNTLLLQMRALHILTAPSRLSYSYACISNMHLYKYIILHELGT